jgi:hypothetical protein
MTPTTWTEDGPTERPDAPAAPPAPVTEAESPDTAVDPGAPRLHAPAHGDSVDALKARLASRGLLRTEPSVRIREVTDPAPAVATPIVAITPHFEPLEPTVPSVDDDAEALEPEPFGPTAPVRCPSCRSSQPVAVDATGFRCGTCDKVFRWAVCSSCDGLSLTIARQESWRCGHCAGYSRSWWRTATAPKEAQEVARKKRSDAAERERRRILERARRRRWKILLAGFLAILACGLSAMVFTSTDASSPQDTARGVCADFTRLKSDIANGSASTAQVEAAIGDLSRRADAATPEVQLAAKELHAAGRPGDATFLVASTKLADACAEAG